MVAAAALVVGIFLCIVIAKRRPGPGAGVVDGRIRVGGPRRPGPGLAEFAYFYVSFTLDIG